MDVRGDVFVYLVICRVLRGCDGGYFFVSYCNYYMNLSVCESLDNIGVVIEDLNFGYIVLLYKCGGGSGIWDVVVIVFVDCFDSCCVYVYVYKYIFGYMIDWR